MTYSKLDRLYKEFWNQYTAALPNNISYSPTNENVFKINSTNTEEYEITLRVDFDRCRYKATSRKKNIAIRISGTKKCYFTNSNDSKITHSNVKICYFKNIESSGRIQLELLKSIHYDYENNERSLGNHPIFHCQSSNDCINEPFFGHNVSIINNQSNVYQHIRIPTANMDMISVLLSIAADHFTSREFAKVLQVYDCKNWHNVLPHISHHERFSPGICFRSRSWYIGG